VLCGLSLLGLAVLVGADSAPDTEFGQRHRDFSRSTVHFLGSAEAALLSARHELDGTETFLRQTLRYAEELLAGHGEFPPYPDAWEDPERIAAWQEAMDSLRTLRERAAEGLESGRIGDAVDRVERMRTRFREAEGASGYPAGTFAFLGLRGVAKAARDLEPEARQRVAEELIERLAEEREQFALARKPLLGPEQRGPFEKRLEKLHGMMRKMVRKQGPIGSEAVRSMHELFPPFHRPDVLAELSGGEEPAEER